MSATLLLLRNERAANAFTASDHAYWLADCDEVETVFRAAYDAILQNIKLRGLGFMRRDELGVAREVDTAKVAHLMAEQAVEAMYHDLDPLTVERFKRFGWPALAPKTEG
jgi:hypothetical protein